MRQLRPLLDLAATCAMLVASCVLIWAVLHQPTSEARSAGHITTVPIPDAPLSLAGAQVLGNKKAQVAVVEFSDFQCPFCAKAARDLVTPVLTNYIRDGRVLFAFRHLPLEMHPEAHSAAQAAECAGVQGKFWEMHDSLFANPRELNRTKFLERADRLRLEQPKFAECLNGGMADEVNADMAEATRLGVRTTPTFMFGFMEAADSFRVNRVVTGALDASKFRQIVDTLLDQRRGN